MLGFNLQAADFNNDGKMDLISTPNPVSLNMQGTIPPSIPTWDEVAAPVSVYLNTTPTGGPLSFNVVSTGPTDEYLGFLQVGDFNLDGNMDIGLAFASRDGTTFAVGTGDGHGGFDTFQRYIAYTNTADGVYDQWEREVVAFGVGDFNGDRQLDIAATATMLNDGLGNAVSITGLSYNKTFALPGALPTNPPPAFAGQPYSLQLTPTGGDSTKPYTFTLDPQSVPLPAGLTMSAAGLISGTPTQSGPFQLTLDVSQPSGPRGSSPIYIYMLVNPAAPVVLNLLPQNLPGGMVNQFYSQQVSATGGTGAVTFSLISGQLPYGLTLSPAGLISGVPTMSGNFGFSVYAVDSGTGSGSRSYSVTIGSNQPITFQTGPLPQSTVNQPYSQMITAVGGNGGPYTYTVTQGALPPGVTLTTGGLLAGTPTALGNYAFTLTAAAGGVMASQGYVVQVVPVLAQPPIVIGLTRIGVNTLAVAFSQPMKASGAQSIRNYVLSTAGPDGVWGTKDDYVIALRPPFYNAVTQTTTITTACSKFPLNWLYRLVIKGVPPAGVSNAQGVFLGGRGADQPGTDYVRTFQGKEIPYVVPS